MTDAVPKELGIISIGWFLLYLLLFSNDLCINYCYALETKTNEIRSCYSRERYLPLLSSYYDIRDELIARTEDCEQDILIRYKMVYQK